MDDVDVASGVTIGPHAVKPLHLDIPISVSDMSSGAISEEAKVALSHRVAAAPTFWTLCRCRWD